MVVFAVWIIEYQAGLVRYFDSFGYGLTIIVILISYALSRIFNRNTLAKTLVFVHAAIYLLMLAVLGFLSAAEDGNLYSIATSLQWIPIIYILAFLFLSKRLAIIAAISVYLILVAMLLLTFSGLFPVQNHELRLLMVNMSLSHGLYIVCMFAVVRLKRDSKKQTVIARDLEKAVNFDSMLKIANRRHLQQLMDSYESNQQAVTLLLIDIDNFKQINDTYGHQAGDEVLLTLVECIKKNLRPSDVIGRWGGEEFMILTQGALGEDVTILAERVRRAVEHETFPHVQDVTISMGVADLNDGLDTESAFRSADRALYKAKRSGRNKVVIHS
ncbi:MAG: GGDEF domain-containing protein [Aliiglaciecola sp.]